MVSRKKTIRKGTVTRVTLPERGLIGERSAPPEGGRGKGGVLTSETPEAFFHVPMVSDL